MYAVIQFVIYIGIILLLAKPVGWYIQRVFPGEAHPLARVLGPVERGIYRVIGTDPARR